MSKKETAAMLDKKLDPKLSHTIFVCGLVMVAVGLSCCASLSAQYRCCSFSARGARSFQKL